MQLYVTKYREDSPSLTLEVVYAKSAAHAHQIRALERGATVEDADSNFDLAAWRVIDRARIKENHILVWERSDCAEVEESWDYIDWCEHGWSMANEVGREGVSIARCEPVDLDGYLVPAKA